LNSKRGHTQAKKFLDEKARYQKFVRQCIICQKQGYDEQKLQERSEAVYRQQIQKYYDPIVLDSLGRCEECVARLND